MNEVISIFKPVGLTPYQVIEKLKLLNHAYGEEKISYAGRLDPMAEGLLILLIGEENKKRHEYENLEKEYEFEILFGVSSDTYDILGIVDEKSPKIENEIPRRILELLSGFCGKQSQPFPPYSSKPVNGKPLYWWARMNRLSEIEIPVRDIDIKEIRHLGTSNLAAEQIKKNINQRIKLVEGDFRQEEILNCWKDFFEKNKQEEFCVMKFSTTVSSGTYIRSLAKRMGDMIGIPSLAFSIKRVRVGEFDLASCLMLD